MELKISRPNEKQKIALLDRHKYIAYGGARGGGKSWFVQTKAKLLCLKFTGIKVLIVRRTYPELINNHVEPLCASLRVGSKNDWIARYNKSDKLFRFRNGSQIKLGYCNNANDVRQYQGAEYDVIFIDEATQLPWEWVEKIIMCCRGINDFPKRIYFTCNPGGVGHEWVKRLFVDRKFNDGERPEDYSFVQALATDNYALMKTNPDYLHQLEMLPEKLKKAWLYGEWDIFEGQFFEEFRDLPEHYKDHVGSHVIEPFDIPKDWKIYMSYDFGYAKPFSFQWWAVDYEGCAYMIAELYGCTGEPNEGVKWTPQEQFAKVRDMEACHPLLKGRRIAGRVADPAIWNAETGESVAETAAKARIYFDKADNQRISGWMQCHYRMAFDASGHAMMYIFSTCRHAIRTIPLMVYDETHVEDLDTSLEDHICDAMRYFFMTKPIPPRTAEVHKEIGDDPLNQRSGDKNVYTYANL